VLVAAHVLLRLPYRRQNLSARRDAVQSPACEATKDVVCLP
jgi:hypothetical protein